MSIPAIFSNSFRFATCLMTTLALCSGQNARAVTFATSSSLAFGNWVKVKVTESGIQQISDAQLNAWGLDPEKTVVYGIGAAAYLSSEFSADIPDALVPTYSEHTSDGRLLFYGEGPAHYDIAFADSLYTFSREISPYSSYSAYFLTDSATDAYSTTAREYTRSADPTTNHLSVNYIENDLQNDFQVGAFMWDTDFTTGSVTQDFKITDFATAGVSVSVDGVTQTPTFATLYNVYMAQVNNEFSLVPEVPTGWSVTGTPIDKSILAYTTLTLVNTGSYTMSLNTELTDEELADYDFIFESKASLTSAIQSEAATDYRAFIYPRHNHLGSSELEMFFAGSTSGENAKISTSATSTEVWNITDLTNIYPYQVSSPDADGAVEFTFDTDNTSEHIGRYIAFDATAEHHTPELIGTVAGQNLHATEATDLLIITTDDFLSSAEELAQYHRDYMGQEVTVVTQQQVFNEFSGGTPSATAFHRMAKMLYDRYPNQFRNLLFYGPGYWDNRHILNDFSFETLITYQTEKISDLSYATAYVSDTYFGMLSDTFQQSNIIYEPLSIGVGRIPVTSAADAKSVNNKILRYMTTSLPGSVANSVLMTSDAGDNCQHFTQSEEATQLLLSNRPWLTVHKAPLAGFSDSDYSTHVSEITSQSLVSGVSLFAYNGHGNQDGFFWNKTLNSATDYDYPPFAMLATCSAYAFHVIANSMAESMLYKEDGGAIAAIGAMCSVYLPYNQYYNLSIMAAWSQAKAGETFGDMLVAAKKYFIDNYSSISQVSQIFTNAICYNFCGDPALTLPASSFGASIEKVDGVEAPDSVAVKPRVPISLEGAVTKADGSVNTDFNGTATLYLYEAPYTATTRSGSSQTEIDYSDDSYLLAQVGTKVENGRFSAELTAPQPQRTDEASRLIIIAENEENQQAAGVYGGLIFGEYDETDDSSLTAAAPTITDLYFDTPGNGSGANVDTDTDLTLLIDAPAGLNSAASNIGYTLRATVDGDSPVDRSLINIASLPDNQYQVTVKLRSLNEGRHDVAVSVADNCLQRADASASFTVGAVTAGQLIVDADALPARESLTFDLESELTLTSHRLIIENAAKEAVFTGTVTFPYEWNLTDTEGNPVDEGFYTAYAISSDSDNTVTSTPKVQITVLKPVQ